jgi:hypothetical protein
MDNLNVDKLIAERVMGYEVTHENGWNCIEARGDGRSGYFSPTSEIRHAWQVLDKFPKAKIETFHNGVSCEVFSYNDFTGVFKSEAKECAEDIQRAICSAVIKASGLEESE